MTMLDERFLSDTQLQERQQEIEHSIKDLEYIFFSSIQQKIIDNII